MPRSARGCARAPREVTKMPTDTAFADPEMGEPFLLTPGPLTTSAAVKRAMVHDWGSRDAGFGHSPLPR